MTPKFEELLYQLGLTAQGCWDNMDEYDHAAIERFAELIVIEASKPLNNVFIQGGGTYGEKIRMSFGMKP